MAWQISGQYMETCSCTFLCPCITSNLQARPSEGDCKAALGMHIEKGSKDGVSLDGVDFIAMLQSDGPMANGNMRVGLIIDSDASDDQADAVTAIASGQVGGPMGMLAPLVGHFAGVTRAKISIAQDGGQWTCRAGDLVDQASDALLNMEGQPLVLDNASHPVNSRIGLATAARSSFHAFGIDWDDSSGTRNGHYAPFSWSG